MPTSRSPGRKIFLLFVFVELIIAMSFRSLRFSIFAGAAPQVAAAGHGWELLLLGVLVQFDAVRETFGIRMPTLADLALALAVSAFVVAALEATKAYLRRTPQGAAARRQHLAGPGPAVTASRGAPGIGDDRCPGHPGSFPRCRRSAIIRSPLVNPAPHRRR